MLTCCYAIRKPSQNVNTGPWVTQGRTEAEVELPEKMGRREGPEKANMPESLTQKS